MRFFLPVLLSLFPLDEPEKIVRSAVEEAAEKGYSYTVGGRFRRSGEFMPGPLLVSRIRWYASVKYKEAIIFKGQEGLWKFYGDVLGERVENPDPELEDIVDTLLNAAPPHEMLLELFETVRRGKKTEVRRIDGVRCDVYVFRFDPDRLKEYLEKRIENAVRDGRIQKPDYIRWRTRSGILRFYISRNDGSLVRALDRRYVKLGYKTTGVDKVRRYITEMTFDFRRVGSAKPEIPDVVRKRLKIPEGE